MSKSAVNRIIAVAVLAVISVAAILIFKSRIVVSPRLSEGYGRKLHPRRDDREA